MTALGSRVSSMVVVVATYLAVYLGWQVFGWGGPDARPVIGDLALVPVYGGAAIMAWLASRRCAGVARLRSAWRLIAIGEVFYLLGLMAQTCYEAFAGSKPFPSLADPGYLLFAPFVFAGLLHFPFAPEARGERIRRVTDCVIIAIAGGAVIWAVLLGPAAVSGGTTLQTVVSVAAPAGDLILIGGLATAILRQTLPVSAVAMRLLTVGLLVIVAADLVYGWLSLHSEYRGGHPVDSLYIAALAMFLLGAAAQPAPGVAGGLRPTRHPARASWVPWLAVGIVFVVLGIAILNEDHAHDHQLLVTTVVVIVLVAIRHLSAQRDLLAANRELEAAHAELDALATTDPVTLLPNHRALVASINQEIARAQRRGTRAAVAFVDVDHFKALNDTFGHAAGDRALAELGALAKSCLRANDVVGRWGGEEFVILLADTGAEAAMIVAERLRTAVAAHRFAGDAKARLTCSIGVAVYPDDGRTRRELLISADQAMYTAKRFGRNQTFAASDPAVPAVGPHSQATTAGVDEDALTGAVEALALLVDQRDSYTGAHAADVAELSRRLAVELGCDPVQAAGIAMAARLHDIGKVAVPDAILLKPGRLTDDEWAFMHQHPVVGADVLSRIPALRPITAAVRAHHERWDGTGYPDGVAGEDIPLAARIIAVADAFDAMITARPYSDPIPPSAALAELARCAGTQFDPSVVAAMEGALPLWDVAEVLNPAAAS